MVTAPMNLTRRIESCELLRYPLEDPLAESHTENWKSPRAMEETRFVCILNLTRRIESLRRRSACRVLRGVNLTRRIERDLYHTVTSIEAPILNLTRRIESSMRSSRSTVIKLVWISHGELKALVWVEDTLYGFEGESHTENWKITLKVTVHG